MAETDETVMLQKIKELVYAEVERASDTAWMGTPLLPVYLQLKTMEKLERIIENQTFLDGKLTAFWNEMAEEKRE
jgi:hypothetical protein